MSNAAADNPIATNAQANVDKICGRRFNTDNAVPAGTTTQTICSKYTGMSFYCTEGCFDKNFFSFLPRFLSSLTIGIHIAFSIFSENEFGAVVTIFSIWA